MDKVVWAEGVFLGQQHFQLWDNYIERGLHLRGLLASPFAWGVLSLAVDAEALSYGSFRLTEVTAIFPDGRLVRHDAGQPLACDPGGTGGEVVDIHLCVPANHDIEGIAGYPDHHQSCGWTAECRQVEDHYDATRQREVMLARPNLFLLSSGEVPESCLSLKIAELRNEGDGTYQPVAEFIPPACRIAASPTLRGVLGRLVEMAGAKLRAIKELQRHRDAGSSAAAHVDPAQQVLCQTLGALHPALLHFQQHPELAPESLYRLLSQTAGMLCAFHPELGSERIPRYRHDQPGPVFFGLERLYGELLKVASTGRSTPLSLQREADGLYAASGIDRPVFRDENFFLEVFFEAEDPAWITDFARQAKVSSRSTIEMTVASALPGVRLVHTQRPPAKLSTRSGCEYFRLEPRGDFWSAMVEEGTLAVFLPHPFTQAAVELITIRE